MTGPTPRKRQETRRPFDAVRRSVCGNCPTGCGVKGFVQGGELVDLFGDEEHPANKGSFCPKGLLTWVLLRHPHRITRPRVRERLDAPFREMSWEEALRLTASRLRTLVTENGAGSVVVHASPSAPFGHVFGASRFAAALGTPHSPDRFLAQPFGTAGRIARMFGIPAAQLLMNSQRDWANSRCVLLVGSDLGATDPVTLGPLVDVRDRGGSVVVVDSKTTITAVKASYFVRVNPGTEAVFLGAVARQLIDDGRVERSFVDEATQGYDALASSLAGFAPEKAASICGVKVEDVRTVASVVGAAHPMQVMCGDWASRASMSDEVLAMCAAVACLRGSIGIPGGGFNVLNASPFARADAEPTRIEEILLGTQSTSALLVHGNAVARMAGGAAVRERLTQVPLVVQLGGFDDETSAYAHVQLPVALWAEEAGLVANGNGRALQWRDALVAPVGECRPALDVWADLAAAAGLELKSMDGSRGLALARAAARAALGETPVTRAIDLGALDPGTMPPGGVLWPATTAEDIAFENDRFIRGDVRGRNILFRRNRSFPGAPGRFPTPSGMIDLAAAAIPIDAAAAPFTRRQGGARELRMVASLAVDYIDDWSGAAPTPGRAPLGPIIRIHPKTAQRLGLAPGAFAVLANAMGEIAGRVEHSLTVSPDTIWCIETPGRRSQAMSCFGLFDAPASGAPPDAFAYVSVRPR